MTFLLKGEPHQLDQKAESLMKSVPNSYILPVHSLAHVARFMAINPTLIPIIVVNTTNFHYMEQLNILQLLKCVATGDTFSINKVGEQFTFTPPPLSYIITDLDDVSLNHRCIEIEEVSG